MNPDSIQDYLAERNPDAAFRLVNEILDRTETLLSANPEIGRHGRISGTRELVLSNTSYVIAYRVTGAVMHGARDWPKGFA
jgi:plasmid stabilization system protein ParE